MSVICTYMCPTFMTHAAMCPLEVTVCPVYTLSACTGHGVYTVDTGPTSPTPMHCAHFGYEHGASHIDAHSPSFEPATLSLWDAVMCMDLCVHTKVARWRALFRTLVYIYVLCLKFCR